MNQNLKWNENMKSHFRMDNFIIYIHRNIHRNILLKKERFLKSDQLDKCLFLYTFIYLNK